MISQSQIKLLRALHRKKQRDRHRIYLAEGEKLITEFSGAGYGAGHRIEQIFATGDWIEAHGTLLESFAGRIVQVTPAEMKKISTMVTPPGAPAMITMPPSQPSFDTLRHDPALVFESIRDPGNLGTIIRTADWFGFRQLVCTPDSVDLFNPKVVQSTMGAITRVQVHYMEIGELLARKEIQEKPVYGTFLQGENIYSTRWEKAPLILFGNESKGLSGSYDRYIGKRLCIPSHQDGRVGSESLNVASSVAVVCSEYRRQTGISRPIQSRN
jgi:TrmH family RNA methyltransferase